MMIPHHNTDYSADNINNIDDNDSSSTTHQTTNEHSTNNNSNNNSNNTSIESTPSLRPPSSAEIDLTRRVKRLSLVNHPSDDELSENNGSRVSWNDFAQLAEWWKNNLADKKMDFAQFNSALATIFNITDPVVQKDLFVRMDVNGDNTIDSREFFVGVLPMFRQASEEDRMKMMFSLYDDDHNGYISVDEVYAIQEYVLRVKGEEINEESLKREVLLRFRAADENNDGKIDFEEFKHAQQSKLIVSLF